jgi:hypothetical protein
VLAGKVLAESIFFNYTHLACRLKPPLAECLPFHQLLMVGQLGFQVHTALLASLNLVLQLLDLLDPLLVLTG